MVLLMGISNSYCQVLRYYCYRRHVCGHPKNVSDTHTGSKRGALPQSKSKSNLIPDWTDPEAISIRCSAQPGAARFIFVCRSRMNVYPAPPDHGRGRKWASDWDREGVYRSS